MRIVFMGTPEFAVASLAALQESSHELVAVVTAPDKPAGRGKKLSPSAVKRYALEHDLQLLQPLKLRDPDFIAQLQELAADLFVVVAFRMLPKAVWELPPLGSINLHASLLPQYRGAAPINWAIIHGESETGLTSFFLREEIDTGPVIFQTSLSIDPDENAGHLHDRMMLAGAQLLQKTVEAIARGNAPQLPQKLASKAPLKQAPKIFKEDCHLDFRDTVISLHNRIRGLAPYPGAFAYWERPEQERQSLKLLAARPALDLNQPLAPAGKLYKLGRKRLFVAAKDGWLELLKLQTAGRKAMNSADFLNGQPSDSLGYLILSC